MSEGMIIRRGGSGNVFAMVLVTYPSGSTLTATNVSGKKDVSSTQRLYYVKKPSSGTTQSCRFTITSGSQTKYQDVTDITIGTAHSIELSYSYIIFANGAYGTSGALSYVTNLQDTSTVSQTIEDGNLILKHKADGVAVYGICWYAPQLSVRGYSKIHCKIKYSGYNAASRNGYKVGLRLAAPSSGSLTPDTDYYQNCYETAASPTEQEFDINIENATSGGNENYYVVISGVNPDLNKWQTITLTELWLE